MCYLIINNSKLYKETDKAYVYKTKTRNAEFFSIPKSQIKSTKQGKIRINEVHSDDGRVFTLSSFIYNKLKSKFNQMSEFDIKIFSL
jgi:hypothetical protein